MAQKDIKTELAALQSQRPDLKLYTPETADYEALRKTYIFTEARPAAIARPQTAQDVQALVRACVDKGLEFNVRTGGHNCVGRTLVDGAVLIDMRDIAQVQVSEDKSTAKIGGGILAGGLLKELGQYGLITPCGSVATVGYVGWSTGGGYGPFSSLYGPGVDQIIGAKLVDYRGELIEADDELLTGIRGAGCIFGVIVELTIKVYPLNEMLVSTLIFESSDMQTAWEAMIGGIASLGDAPPALKLQLFITDFPGLGKAIGAIATWASDDHAEGRKMLDKVATFGKCIVNETEAKTTAQYAQDNEKLVTYGVYGRSYTLNLRTWTPTSVKILAEYSATVPSGNAMISVHSLRTRDSIAHESSVFGAFEDHHMIEIVSMTTDPTLQETASTWGQALLREFKEHEDQANILDSAYLSLLDHVDVDLRKMYGRHLDTLVTLKKKYDPQNVFKYAAPRMTGLDS